MPINWPHGLSPYLPRIVMLSHRLEKLQQALDNDLQLLTSVFDGLESHPVFMPIINAFK